MSKFLLDSDILIWHLRGRGEFTGLLRDLEKFGVPGCSALSILEVRLGVKRGEEEKTNLFLGSLKVFDVNREIANQAGGLIRGYKGKGITFDLVDAVIAATCLRNDMILVTGNQKHYPIPGLKFYPFFP
jgi:predicted nucleic acid-binding protein